MIQKDINCTPRDYEVLCDVVSNLHKAISDKTMLTKIMEKIVSLSLWQKADLTCSEELYGEPMMHKGTLMCMKDGSYHMFEVAGRSAIKGDLVYIVDDSSIGDGYKGKYYRVFENVKELQEGNVKIKMTDTYSDTNDYYLILDRSAYITLTSLNIKDHQS